MRKHDRLFGGFLLAALSLQAAAGAHAACGTTAAAAAGIATIQSAVDSAPPALTAGDHCVFIASGTYREQVTVKDIAGNGFRIRISAAPGAAVTVTPPAGSQAAFVLAGDSVSISGLSIQGDSPLPYGVLATGSYIEISSVNVFSHEGSITSAGIVLGSYGKVSTTYVGVRAAHGLYLPGSIGTSAAYSIFETSAAAQYALYLVAAAENRLTGLLASNSAGHCAYLAGRSDSNVIERSTFTGGRGGYGAYLDGGSGNGIRGSVLNGGGNGDYGNGGHGLDIKGGASNRVEDSVLTGGPGGFAGDGGSGAALEAGGDYNAISLSTLTGGAGGLHPAGYASAGGHGLMISGGRSNSVSQSVLRGSAGGDCKGGGGGPGGHGLYIYQGAGNSLSLALLTGGPGGGGGVHNGGFGGHGAYLRSASLNAISRSRMHGGVGAYGKGGPGLVPGEGGHGLYVSGGGSNVIDASLMAGGTGGTGDAVQGGGGGGGLTLNASAANAISRSLMTGGPGAVAWSSGAYGADGHGAGLAAGADSNAITLSTLTSAGRGLALDASASNTVTDSYVRGSTAVFISACSGTAIRSSVLAGASPSGIGVWVGAGNSGLELSADSVAGGAQAAGIVFSGGTFVANLAGLAFADSGAGYNVDAARLSSASRIIMTDAQGPRAGPAFENDPGGVVDWVASGVPPGRPGRPAGVVLGASSITWNWSAAADAVGYRIFSAARPGALIASVPTAAFLQTALPPNTASGITAAGVNGSLLGPLSEAATVYTLAAPPAGLALAQVRTSSITLSWSANANPPGTRYRAQLWTADSGTTTLISTGLTATFTGLRPETRYYLGLAAVNADDISAPAAAVLSAATLPEPPPPPSGLRGATLGVSSISWTWNAVASAAAYRLYRADHPATLIASVSTTTFVATGLSANTGYGVVAVGFNAGGASPLSAAATAYTLAAAPVGLALVRVHSSSVTLAWDAGRNPPVGTAYRVDVWGAAGSTTSVTVQATSAAVAGLSGGATYYLTVSALDHFGTAAACGHILRAVTAPAPRSDWDIGADGGTLALELPAGKVSVVVPPGAFAQAAKMTLSLPAAFPPPDSAVIKAAGIGIGVRITADRPIQPGSEMLVSVSYRAADVSGLGAGKLSLARYDEDRRVWVPLVSAGDAQSRTVTARTRHFSLFQIMQAAPASTVDGVKLFPNPLRPARGHTGVTFVNLPAGSRIRIYDLSGGLVRDMTANALDQAKWDGTNQSGKKAASGVYFVFVQGAGGAKTFKVAVQR